jgi:1,4-alpha-glucan branching enzyme
MMTTNPLDPQNILDIDGYLRPNVPAIIHRHNAFRKWKETIEKYEGGYEIFTKGYLKFGLNLGPKNEVIYKEWAPNAKEAYLIGDFSPLFYFGFLEAITIILQMNGIEQATP